MKTKEKKHNVYHRPGMLKKDELLPLRSGKMELPSLTISGHQKNTDVVIVELHRKGFSTQQIAEKLWTGEKTRMYRDVVNGVVKEWEDYTAGFKRFLHYIENLLS